MKLVIKGKDEVIAARLMFYAIASMKLSTISVEDSIYLIEAKKICLNFIMKPDSYTIKFTPVMILMINNYCNYLSDNLPSYEKNVLLKIMTEMHKQSTNSVINQNLLENGK